MLRVLTYHRVADPAGTPGLDPAQVSATPDDFRLQVRHLASRYRVVDLDRVLEAFRGGRPLPPRAVLITFDDAYRDVGETAWPILRDHGLPATVFVPTDFPGSSGPGFWWDRLHRATAGGGPEAPVPDCDLPAGAPAEGGGRTVRGLREVLGALPPDEAEEIVDRVCGAADGDGAAPPERPPVLDWDELRALRAEGVRLGSHTRTHAPLASVSEERIRYELRGSAAELEERVGKMPRVVCYPYGLHDDRVVRVAREEGFELGFTTLDGLNRAGTTDPLRLRRTNITRRTSPFVFRIRMHPWFAPVDRWRHRDERRRLEAAGGRTG